MKYKFLIPICLSIFLGVILGKIFFNEYDTKTRNVFSEGTKLYFIQIDKSSTKDELVKIYDDTYLILLEEDGYHIYAGITKSYDIAKKIKDYYEESQKNTEIVEKIVSNENFLNILTEYDKVINIATTKEDIISIEKIVISNYKETEEQLYAN